MMETTTELVLILYSQLKHETKRADDNASALATVTNALRTEQSERYRLQSELTELQKKLKRKGVKR